MKCDEMTNYNVQGVRIPAEHGQGEFVKRADVDAAIEELKAENRKLKRALWTARANAYRYIAELIACFNPDYVRNRKMFTPNNLKQKQMNSLKWARLMLKIERKCRAKAEEYK